MRASRLTGILNTYLLVYRPEVEVGDEVCFVIFLRKRLHFDSVSYGAQQGVNELISRSEVGVQEPLSLSLQCEYILVGNAAQNKLDLRCPSLGYHDERFLPLEDGVERQPNVITCGKIKSDAFHILYARSTRAAGGATFYSECVQCPQFRVTHLG